MSLTTQEMDDLVSKLLGARESLHAIDLISSAKAIDEDDCYGVQRKLVREICALGPERAAGFKIAMTSRETQELVGAHEPAYGVLTTATLLGDAGNISLRRMFGPRLEPEIMFVVIEDLSIGAKAGEIRSRTAIAPGIEIPDSRFTDWFGRIRLTDLVCDNCATGRVVVGEAVGRASDFDLRSVEARLVCDGETVATGVGSAVCGDPILAVEWLCQRLARVPSALQAGWVIASGTFAMPVAASAGSYVASFSGLGSVKVTVDD